jgi:hypothetical protein
MFITSKRRYQTNYNAILDAWYNNTRYFNSESQQWVEGLTNGSLGFATTFIKNSFNKSWFDKVLYFLPMLGASDTVADPLGAKWQLINVENKPATDINCDTSLYFNENEGLRSVTGDVVLGDTNYTINTYSFGVGVYLSNTSNISNENDIYKFIGLNDNNYGYSGSSVATTFTYNDISASYTGSTGASNHYAQVQPNSLKLYYSGSLIAQNTSTFNLSGSYNIRFFSSNNALTYGAIYVTDGTLTDAEVADFHSTIRNYLIIPTGKSGV